MTFIFLNGCGSKTIENVDNIDKSADRVADQMQSYEAFMKTYAFELEQLRGELGIFRDSFLPVVVALQSMAQSAQGIDKNVQLAMDQIVPLLEGFKAMVANESKTESVPPAMTEDDLLN